MTGNSLFGLSLKLLLIGFALACIASSAAAQEKTLSERYGGQAADKTNTVLIEMLAYPEYALAARSELVQRGDKALLDVITASGLSDADVRYYAVAILDAISGMEAEEAILKRLDDDDAEVRARAAFAVGKFKKAKHVGPLAEALEKETDEIARGAFITALSAIDSPGVVEPLLKAFTERGDFSALAALANRPGVSRKPLENALKTSKDSTVRKRAAFALGAIADKASIPVLTAVAAEDDDGEVRFAAFLALAAIGDAENIEKISAGGAAISKTLGKTYRDLAELRKEIESVFSQGPDEKIEIIRAALLSAPSRTLVPIISEHLNSENPLTREVSACILGRWGYRECAAELAKALSGPGPIDRRAVVEALGRTGRSEVLPILAREAASKEAPRRSTAAYALSFVRVPEARTLLTPMTSDPDADVRGMAVIALAAFPDRMLTPIFIRALREKDPLVRTAAVEWFGTNRIFSESTAVVANIDDETHPRVQIEIIRAIEKWTVQAGAMLLSRFLTAKYEPAIRIAAAEALGRHKSQPAAFALLRAFNASSGKPSEAAVFLDPIGKTGQMVAMAPLVKLLDDKKWQEPALKTLVVRALGRLGREPAVAKIAAITEKTDAPPGLLTAAVEALGRIGGPAASMTLINFVKKTSAPLDAKRAALEGLVLTNTPEALKIVRGMLVEESLALAAAKALGPKEPQSVLPHLINIIGKSSDPQTRAECAGVLADVPGEAATAALVRALKDEKDSVRLAAAAALIRRGSLAPLKLNLKLRDSLKVSALIVGFEETARNAAIQRLVKALDSTDAPVRHTARMLLANMSSGPEPHGMSLPEDLTASEERERIDAWKDWWRRNRQHLGGK